jgi:hypothetical protein
LKKSLLIFCLIFFTLRAFSQTTETFRDESADLTPKELRRIYQENWDITLTNELTYEDVRLKFISGDSLLIAKGNSSRAFHINDIEIIKFNGRKNTGVGTVLGSFIGIVAVSTFSYTFLPPLGHRNNFESPNNNDKVNLIYGGLVGGILGGIIGTSLYLETQKFDLSSMNFTEKIITIRTQIFGLNPY